MVVVSVDEYIGLDCIGGVCIEWLGVWVVVCFDCGCYLCG